jgi:hypothetical protein
VMTGSSIAGVRGRRGEWCDLRPSPGGDDKVGSTGRSRIMIGAPESLTDN